MNLNPSLIGLQSLICINLYTNPTRVKPPSATLLDNIYTNIQITVDSCESGILTSNISDHLFVFGFFDNMKINKTQNYTRKRDFTEKNIAKFTQKNDKQNVG